MIRVASVCMSAHMLKINSPLIQTPCSHYSHEGERGERGEREREGEGERGGNWESKVIE